MKTFRIITKTETTLTKTYYVEAESKEEAIKKYDSESPDLDLQETDEDDGIEYMETIKETDADGNELPGLEATTKS